MDPGKMDHRYIVVFDGVCNFCNGSVDFIIARDASHRFVFAASQSVAGREMLARFGFDEHNLDTFLLIGNDECLTRSDAALAVAAHLSGPWRMLRHLHVVPRPIRDSLYNLLARHRYQLFGRKDFCRVPDRELRDRFL